ncbi:MAG: hypothetical protein ACQESR_25420 [Planctomycetota bacterium]
MGGIIGIAADSLYAQPGRGRGGPGGRMGGGPPGGGPGGFLARLDRNNNGMLDRDEIQGRTRAMLERIGGDGRLDLSKPVPLKDVERAFEEMRNRRSRGGDDDRGGRGRDRGRGRDNDDRNRDRRRGSSRSEPEENPLVAGFGEVDLFEPVPGFGSLGERFAVTITEEDRQQAQRTLGRYDRNKDAILDQEEIQRGRWRGDPLLYDRNRDGKLTLNELALRYAVRRAESEEGASDSRDRGRGSSGRDDSSSDDASDRRERFIAMMFGRYDGDNNDVIEGEEMRRLGGRGDRYDLNNDGKITRDEFTKAMSGRFNRGGDDDNRSRFFRRRGDDRGGRDDDSNDSSENGDRFSRSSYRILSPSERLAELEGLPEWFARYDMDENGQVEMAEYATTWNEEVIADFSQFDLNGDGIITPTECLEAVDRGAVQGAPRSTGSSDTRYGSRGSTSSSTSSGGSDENGSPEPSEADPAAASSADNPEEVSPTYVKYAVGVIKKYDDNQDGVLTSDEWKSMGKDYASADTDGDGRLTPVELARAVASEN